MTAAMHPRAAALQARFAEIGETMRDLPLYNAALEVEAHGFAPHGEAELAGVLITPWFMNLVLLPLDAAPIDPNGYGASTNVALPGGEYFFLANGDEALGRFRAASLHSPMDVFVDQAQARAEARLRLAEAMTAPEPAETDPALAANGARKALSRRALFGRA